jgi:pyruvate kinase
LPSFENEIISPLLDLSHPLIEKERKLVICRVENDGEIKENKPIYIPGLDWQKDLKLSVLGPNDVKVLHNSIQQGVHMIAVSCVESKDDITYVKKVLGSKGQHIKVLAKLQS